MRQGFLLLLLCQLSSYTLVTPAKVCGRPPVGPNTEDSDFQRVYEAGQEVFLACKPGYTADSGPRKIVCAVSGTWSSSAFKCVPKRCSNPGPLLNGVIHMADIAFQSTINYTCNEGYILHGPNTSECLHDGTWSHALPVCNPVTCGLPEIPKHATVRYSRRVEGNTTEFGDSVAYDCSPPLALLGNEVGFCLPNGSWSEPPECRLVTCPPLAGIPNGFMSFSVIRDHGYGERVRYGCQANYILEGSMEVECKKTGKWSTKPICRAPCTVGIERGRIFYNNRKIWIEDLKPNRVLHNEMLAVYCKNEEKECGYPVVTKCFDGTLKIPECFKEPGRMTYNVRPKTLPSEIKMC
ncbi:beta-2-glycoprotein 1-like [Anguilla anguilla]|uniref:beta-2-glycoprotein 1-like n=1 Tax=Anguilla anguilla TaxID=7936 RepID=UPI0015AFBBA5|nr:beta-2-glycoprotein 1-like [Anguilla anguilla]